MNIDMTEIGRKDRQSTVNILTIPIPEQQSRYGKSVPEIMQPRRALTIFCHYTELVGQSSELPIESSAANLFALPVDKPVRHLSSLQEARLSL
jgi:hypothetical protein